MTFMPARHRIRIVEDRPGSILGYMFDEASFSRRKARSWSDERLLVTLHARATSEAAKEIIRTELERRKAWRMPAGWAVYVSVAAMGVSLMSLAVTVFR